MGLPACEEPFSCRHRNSNKPVAFDPFRENANAKGNLRVLRVSNEGAIHKVTWDPFLSWSIRALEGWQPRITMKLSYDI